MKSVAEIIGMEYKQWDSGTVVTISTQTGSGKSSFILHQLLDWARDHNMPILYLVNRKILKEQLKSRLASEIQAEWASKCPRALLQDYISIRTYQEIEEGLKMGDAQQLKEALSRFRYVVYDECHYFRVDSTFNPATSLSYNYLKKRFDYEIQIFMSATLGETSWYFNLEKLADTPNAYIKMKRYEQRFYYSYEGETKYDYIQLHQIKGEDEIPALIEKTGTQGKWLIFVDSVRKGEKLEKAIKKNLGLEDGVIFVDARYKNDLQKIKQMEQLQQKESISKRVVIATSVLDNGVSFQDEELNNIVIFADTWETFIQMVGRKRKGSEQVNLYICKRNSRFFKDRIRNIDEIMRYYSHYGQIILKAEQNESLKNKISVNAKCQSVLSDMLNNENVRKNLSRFCYFEQGVLRVSEFSIRRLGKLKNFYKTMIDELEKDENAFLRQQAQWLGLENEKIEPILVQKKVETRTEAIQQIRDTIQREYLDKDMDKALNMEFSKKIKKSVTTLLTKENDFSKDDIEKIKTGIRVDRAFSLENFNDFVGHFADELPFEMTKPDQSTYRITKRDAVEELVAN
jgi:hypothetical protein